MRPEGEGVGYCIRTGFVRVLENLESHGIWLSLFPGLESHGKLIF